VLETKRGICLSLDIFCFDGLGQRAAANLNLWLPLARGNAPNDHQDPLRRCCGTTEAVLSGQEFRSRITIRLVVLLPTISLSVLRLWLKHPNKKTRKASCPIIRVIP